MNPISYALRWLKIFLYRSHFKKKQFSKKNKRGWQFLEDIHCPPVQLSAHVIFLLSACSETHLHGIVVPTVQGCIQLSCLIQFELQTSSPHCVAALRHGFSKSGRHYVHMWRGPNNCITAGARWMDNSVLCVCSLRP